MPDESCRTCGGELVRCSLCAECRKVTQWVCRMCHIKTHEHLHLDCLALEPVLANSKNQGLLIEQHRIIRKSRIPESSHKKSGRLHIAVLASICIGLLVIGFGILDNFDPPQSAASTAQPAEKTDVSQPVEKPDNIHNTVVANPITQQAQYDNCLAISDGKTMSIKCPTSYGYVYSAVLGIPQALIAQLHHKRFSLRGLSIIENLNSILVQYEKKLYVTNFVDQ